MSRRCLATSNRSSSTAAGCRRSRSCHGRAGDRRTGSTHGPGRPSRNGPTFVVTIPEQPRFIGIVGLGDSDSGEGIVGMIYGIAPRWRGRGLASRAVRLAARWAAEPARCARCRAADRSGHDRMPARCGERRVRRGRYRHPVRPRHRGDVRGPAIRLDAASEIGGVLVCAIFFLGADPWRVDCRSLDSAKLTAYDACRAA